MKQRIPIKAAQEIAEKYGYDQVMIYARKVDQPAGMGENAKAEIKGGEHMTTYGVSKAHCDAMARIASFLQTKIMGWTKENA
jgi:bisphosphoglycerate-dependent phosphoglycerate mutase